MRRCSQYNLGITLKFAFTNLLISFRYYLAYVTSDSNLNILMNGRLKKMYKCWFCFIQLASCASKLGTDHRSQNGHNAKFKALLALRVAKSSVFSSWWWSIFIFCEKWIMEAMCARLHVYTQWTSPWKGEVHWYTPPFTHWPHTHYCLAEILLLGYEAGRKV